MWIYHVTVEIKCCLRHMIQTFIQQPHWGCNDLHHTRTTTENKAGMGQSAHPLNCMFFFLKNFYFYVTNYPFFAHHWPHQCLSTGHHYATCKQKQRWGKERGNGWCFHPFPRYVYLLKCWLYTLIVFFTTTRLHYNNKEEGHSSSLHQKYDWHDQEGGEIPPSLVETISSTWSI